MSRVALIIAMCEGEQEVARAAVASLLRATPGDRTTLFVVDDASASHVGEAVAHFARAQGCEAHVRRLDAPLGFRGCVSRTVQGLRMAGESGQEFDRVIKMDPDTLVLRADLGAELDRLGASGAGMWGLCRPMRGRDLLLLCMDLLPLGFRRARKDGRIQRSWTLRRLRPVWWSGIGWRAIAGGFRGRHPGGGFYVIGGQTLREMSRRGYLSRFRENRHGFVTSEEDLIATLLTLACGHAVTELRDANPNWGRLNVPKEEPVESVLARGHFVVHPIKRKDPRAAALRSWADPAEPNRTAG